jgi:hypothetical protein
MSESRLTAEEREALVDLLNACPQCGCSVSGHDMPGVGCLRSSCTCPLDREAATLGAFDAARLAERDAALERVRALPDRWEAEADAGFGRWFEHAEAAADLRAALSPRAGDTGGEA